MSLDDAYAVPPHVENGLEYPDWWARDAAAYRAKARVEPNIAYGPGERHALDLFLPEGDPHGLLVFVHGGFWRKFDRSYWSHLAAGAVAQGWAVAMPSYDLCPNVRIADITRQIADAVTRAASLIEGPIVLAGHSAGGHLVSRMLEPGLLPDEVAARLTRVMPISPLSDLRPLMQTAMNDDFQLNDRTAAAESPVFMDERHDVPVTVWVGAAERPAFLDQARWLADAWGCDLMIAGGKHHFDVIEPLADPESDLVKLLVGQVTSGRQPEA